MHKLITLEDNYHFKCSKKIRDFYNPDFIYLPIYADAIINLEDNDSVKKNEILSEGNDNYFASSISGIVCSAENKSINHQPISCLKIANDFKEKELKIKNSKKDFNKLTHDDILEILETFHLKTLKTKLSRKNYQNIVINGITDEPYVQNKSFYLNTYYEEILDTFDLLTNIYHSQNNVVALKNIDSENITSFLSLIGSYPNLHVAILNDLYLLEKKFFLLEHLHYDLSKTLILDPEEVWILYNALKHNRKLNTKLITIMGSGIPEGKMVNVKIYTSVKELINFLYPNLSNNYLFIKNGLMSGQEINIQDEIVTEDFASLFIMKKENITESTCLNCGKCYEICPIKVNPMISKKYHQKSKNCLDCGLCSYICPAKINLRKYLKGENNE